MAKRRCRRVQPSALCPSSMSGGEIKAATFLGETPLNQLDFHHRAVFSSCCRCCERALRLTSPLLTLGLTLTTLAIALGF